MRFAMRQGKILPWAYIRPAVQPFGVKSFHGQHAIRQTLSFPICAASDVQMRMAIQAFSLLKAAHTYGKYALYWIGC
jgi:hypothetical protein